MDDHRRVHLTAKTTAQPPAEHSVDASRARQHLISAWTSHELRSPLAAILGFAQLLELDPLQPHQREGVSYILSAGRQMLAVLDKAIDPGPVRPTAHGVAVEPLVREVVGVFIPLATARGVDVAIDLHAVGGCVVRGDNLRVCQVLLNLLSTAAGHNRAGGQITVRGEIAGDTLRLHVIDTDEGIENGRLHDLLQPCEHLGAEPGAGQATGLGLSFSRQMTDLMGGTLTAHSECGVGTTFTLELPIEGRAPS